ncbi:hypothetical protein AB0M43_02410 [Longispora sp. NPDC051575]|uniref:hypothetical protein n=1 Tax=Longispora sp. NPDC051575 TaxID=3154943 RepID=UPI00341602A6
MNATLLTLAVLALVVYSLRTGRSGALAGSGPAVADRDTERVLADLTALPETGSAPTPATAGTRARVRTPHPVR